MEPSDEGINYELLKQHEKIHYYDDIILYEDELADNGIAELRVKVVCKLAHHTAVYGEIVGSKMFCKSLLEH